MQLKNVQVTEYKSIWDSNTFEVGDITCLVGKNEAGKTAILEALYRLNPVIEGDGDFDVTDDYPRSDVEDYQIAVEEGQRKPARVITATFELGAKELDVVAERFGPNAITSNKITLYKGYKNQRTVDCVADYEKALTYVIENSSIPKPLVDELLKDVSAEHLTTALAEAEQTEDVTTIRTLVADIAKRPNLGNYIYNEILKSYLPKFLYFDDYYQMKGHDNLEQLKKRRDTDSLEKHDYPLLGLIARARLDFEELLSPTRTRQLKNKLEGAGNHLTRKIIKYWSQNKHLKLKFDVRPAQPGDPEGMTTGTNIWGDVEDTIHDVTTEMGTRSKGFVWFFSFLAWYEEHCKTDEPVILLLDEPGLSLHGRAQEDLLRYFDAEILGKHQLLYTTHSPFMVDANRFDRVRIVQDKSIESQEPLPQEERGTKVFTDVLNANEDSLFPLQGALGYEVHQALFVGPNNLIVEGVSDLLYLQTISGVLDRQGRVTLGDRWTITPVGGSDKVPTFVALIGANTQLKLATLIDFQKKDQQTIENLFKKKLLHKNNVHTFADYTGTGEADIEDMFENSFYVELVNDEYKSVLSKNVTLAALPKGGDRILPRIEGFLDDNPLTAKAGFNHYRPARYLSENIGKLESKISDDTLDRFEDAFKALNALL